MPPPIISSTADSLHCSLFSNPTSELEGEEDEDVDIETVFFFEDNEIICGQQVAGSTLRWEIIGRAARALDVTTTGNFGVPVFRFEDDV